MYLIKNGNKIKLRVFMKKCKTCGEVLLWKFYYKDNNKIGLSARCKTCTKSKYTYICECCGKEFKHYKKNVRFCSNECRGKSKTAAIKAKCEYCGKEFTTIKSMYNRSKHHFCSRECSSKYQDKKIEVKCDYCGKTTKQGRPQINKTNKHFCDAKCHAKWMSENQCGENSPTWNPNIDKNERIEGRHYKEYNDFIALRLKDSDYTCQISLKRGGRLNVHHLNGWNWDKDNRLNPFNTIVISEEIHKDFHNRYGNGNNTYSQFLEYLQYLYNKTKQQHLLKLIKDIKNYFENY